MPIVEMLRLVMSEGNSLALRLSLQQEALITN